MFLERSLDVLPANGAQHLWPREMRLKMPLDRIEHLSNYVAPC